MAKLALSGWEEPAEGGEEYPHKLSSPMPFFWTMVIFLIIVARKVWRGDFDRGKPGFFTSRRGDYENVEVMGLYWHFVDLVWVFIFAFFYLW